MSSAAASSRQYHGRPRQARTRYRRACHPCGFDHDARPPPLLRFALYPVSHFPPIFTCTSSECTGIAEAGVSFLVLLATCPGSQSHRPATTR